MQRLIALAISSCITVGFIQPVVADLRPDEIAVLCSRESVDSRKVAAYYAKVRGVPTENVLAITMPRGQDLSREDWRTKVRPAIRRWLADENRLKKIRCFVTTWDVPLRILQAEGDPEVRQLVAYFTDARKRRVGQLGDFVRILNEWSGADASASVTFDNNSGLEDIKTVLDQSFADAQSKIIPIADEVERAAKLQQLQTIYFRSVGLNMMAQSLAHQLQAGASNTNPKMRSEFDLARGRTLGLREGRAALEGMPSGLDRDPQMLSLIQLSDGIFGTLAWIDEQIKVLQKNESHASFDSELSVVAWPDHTLIRWQPNFLNYRYDDSAIRDFRTTFMVSRLEAPTLKRTREIIDQAIEVEKTGLTGKVYFDARAAPSLPHRAYDESLTRATELIQKHTDLEVVLESTALLFNENSAPNAAIYCGWISLGKYIDAFDWVPGAVGYHMASSEAQTLRDPNSQVWCKRMLEDGVVATLGPVYEPYITGFPLPDQFFALLLSGQFSLVECYYRCLPHTSWTMTLVGDPLYSPFKANPALRTDDLDPQIRRVLFGPTAVFDSHETGPPPADATPTASVP